MFQLPPDDVLVDDALGQPETLSITVINNNDDGQASDHLMQDECPPPNPADDVLDEDDAHDNDAMDEDIAYEYEDEEDDDNNGGGDWDGKPNDDDYTNQHDVENDAKSELALPTFSYPINAIPELHRNIIEHAMNVDWDTDFPWDFQVVSVNKGTFQDDKIVYLISRTGFGKSAAPLTIAMVRHGIIIVMVPLLGLGSD